MRGMALITAFAALPTISVADAWAVFEARCLLPFEHQAEPVVDGLPQQPVDQMHDARLVFGPTAEGYLLVLDAAPSDGERACAVQVPGAVGMSPDYIAWVDEVTTGQSYVHLGDVLASDQWIEPQVHVAARLSGAGATYRVLETDLES